MQMSLNHTQYGFDSDQFVRLHLFFVFWRQTRCLPSPTDVHRGFICFSDETWFILSHIQCRIRITKGNFVVIWLGFIREVVLMHWTKLMWTLSTDKCSAEEEILCPENQKNLYVSVEFSPPPLCIMISTQCTLKIRCVFCSWLLWNRKFTTGRY